MKNIQVIFFNNVSKEDVYLVGGKGANLGELVQAGFNVPDGFCVTTIAYKGFIEQIKQNQIFNKINTLEISDVNNIREASKQIRRLINDTSIEKSLVMEIEKALKDIDSDGGFAIRSSATAEDLPNASFAGQHDTYLNIYGRENIIKYIKACWASLYTERAIMYRIENGIKHSEVSMAVVVQKMIESQKSGIIFTANPVTNNRNVLTIDAGFGLGEALVSGIVSADLYKVNKAKIKIIEKKIACKKLQIKYDKNGGTKKETISTDNQEKQVLEDSQILELAKLGKNIEKHYGVPQDVEWSIDSNNRIYITQSRAITTLFPLPYPQPTDGRLHVYVSFNHVQVMPETIKPLGQSMIRLLLPFGKDIDNLQSESPILFPAGGRLYGDITSLLGVWPFNIIELKLLQYVDSMMANAVKKVVCRKEFKNNKNPKGVRKETFKILFPIIKKVVRNITLGNYDYFVDKANIFCDDYVKKIEYKLNSCTGRVKRLEVIKETSSNIFIDLFNELIKYISTGIASYKILNDMILKIDKDNSLAKKLVSGLEGNVTTEMGLLVGDLADLIRERPKLLSLLENKSAKETIFEIIKNGDEEIKTAFANFFDKYGVRGIGEIDITKERYRENPAPIVQSILNNVKSFDRNEHRKKYKKLIGEANLASKQIINMVKNSNLGKLKVKKAERLINNIRRFMPLREHPKYTIIRCFGLYKDILLNEAKYIEKCGLIDDKHDIYYLHLDEIIDIVKNEANYKEIIKVRKEEFKLYEKLTPPRVLTSEGEIVKGTYYNENCPKNAIKGTPVSSGVIEGKAKVVLNPNNVVLKEGEILVAPFTDPGWAPLFVNARGLIIEVGGLMTHGAVVAREYGIPAVVGVENATKLIKTGDTIRVNGDLGFIEIIS